MEMGGWAGAAPSSKVTVNNINREMSKIEFLQNCIPPRKSRDGSYTEAFKIRMVFLATNGTRSHVRKKFNIPETTLREWIKNPPKKETV